MGYRSMMMTEDMNLALPDWFVEKYQDELHIGKAINKDSKAVPGLPISSKYERKYYSGEEEELFLDLQKVYKKYLKDTPWWSDDDDPCLQAAIMHEDGLVEKVSIYKGRIVIQKDDGCYQC